MTVIKKASPDPIDVEVGLNLRRLRRERGISQTEIGEAIGITFQQFQKYERGTNRISASMLVKAAAVLGVQAGDLLPRTDAARLPPSAQHLSIDGAEELLAKFAAIQSRRSRRLIVELVRSLQSTDEARNSDAAEN